MPCPTCHPIVTRRTRESGDPETLDLFAAPRRARPAPPARRPRPTVARGSATSAAAARAIEPRAGTLRARVLDYVRACGPRGATRQEIADALIGMKKDTVNGRCAELLYSDPPFVIETGERREKCAVVVAIEHCRHTTSHREAKSA